MLGFGTLFLYLGYFTQCFISESVIHSVHTKDPQRISAFAGYYGKEIMPLGWILIMIFIPISTSILPSQTLEIQGKFLYNNGEGAYMAEHSSRRTIESNTGIETAVGHSSMFIGGMVLVLIFYLIPQDASEVTSHYRSFSEQHIQVIYGMFFAVTLIAAVMFALLPTKQYDSIASNSPRIIPNFKTHMKNLGKAFIHPNMILLSFTFLYMGFLVSFFLGIYPTTLSFTASLVHDVYIVALYSFFVGLAELSGGVLIRPLIKKIVNYKLQVVMIVHVLVVVAAMALFQLSTPERSTIEPNDESSLFLQPNRYLACAVGYLIGMGDFTLTMARVIICQMAVPKHRNEVFSLTRIYQCISSCIVLFLSSYMTVTYWTTVMLVGMVVGVTTFLIVVTNTSSKNVISPLKKYVVPKLSSQSSKAICYTIHNP
ncbi:hypothetical protein NECAME_05729 [Necator americanus]|uniref:Uncharacterized protein n=1 Tax=Necator americanus TaxID=51031 RepID=W2TZB6_NECAM|nr:hypothetical protein NECAME_05729 [Necator americanus]ETN87009.1 hypothetical protein NECAME_05729 [Necator americanus]